MIICRAFLGLALLFILAQPAFAQGKIVDEARIRSLLGDGEKVPVIVLFQVDRWQDLAARSAVREIPDSRKMTAADPDRQLRSAIKAGADSLLADLPAKSFTHKRTFSVVPGMALSVDEAALQRLAADPRVARIVENRPEPLPPMPEMPEQEDISKPQLNDSTSIVGADIAWAKGYTGKGQYVAVLDTGVRTSHEMFAGKAIVEACFSSIEPAYGVTSLCPNGQLEQYGPGAAAPGAVDPVYDSHGTHVAGIAAGENAAYSSGEPRRGVAPDAGLIAVQVFSNVAGSYGSSSDDQISALEYVYSLSGSYRIAAVNMSLGGYAQKSEYCDDDGRRVIIDQLRNAGIATVIASGNYGYCGFISPPACISSAIAVGATDKDDVEAGYSNYHPVLQEFYAPGSFIVSSVATGDSDYASYSGTSMATPHVAGAIAVLHQAFPGDDVSAIENKLRQTGTPITGTCPGATAIPRINIDRAIEEFKFPWPAFLPAITTKAE